WNQQRQTVANRYHQLLSPIDLIRRPQNSINGVAVWNQYTLLIEAAPVNSGDSRDRIRDHLRDQGIICMVYYPIPLHLQAVYADLPYRQGQFPKAEQAAHQVLSLPMFPELSADQQETVVYGLKNALADCL
ncbi:MAG: DegT/DnrJ/EryC1/StrS family aminotransferase, partial [Pseudomonadota bacterium]